MNRNHILLYSLDQPALEHILFTQIHFNNMHVVYFLAGGWDLSSIQHADPQIVRP